MTGAGVWRLPPQYDAIYEAVGPVFAALYEPAEVADAWHQEQPPDVEDLDGPWHLYWDWWCNRCAERCNDDRPCDCCDLDQDTT